MPERDTAIDIVRTVGIVAIVAGHVWEDPIVRDAVFTWHVPVFFFLSGYLWKTGRSVRTELANRSRTLLKPYAFWWPIIFVPYLALLALTHQLDFARVVGPIYGGSFAGGPFATFWFVFALFATAVIWRALERTPLWVRAAVIVIGVCLAVLAGPVLAATPLAVGSAIPALVFLAAGQLARTFEPTRSRGAIVALCLVVVSVALIATGISAPLDIKKGNWGTPVLSIAVAIALSWALVLLAKVIAGRWARWATAFALCGFTVVLVHPSIIWLSNPFDVPRLLVFVVAIGVPVAIGTIALRTRASQWATGIPRRDHLVAH